MSETTILGVGGDRDVLPVIEDSPLAAAAATLAWERFRTMTILCGLFEFDLGGMLVLIVPVETPNSAETIVEDIKELESNEADGYLGVLLAGVAAHECAPRN